MSNNKQVTFVSAWVESYGGINKETPHTVNYPENVDISEQLKKFDADSGIILVFPPGYRYMVSEGNQGTGKSSLLKCLLEIFGNAVIGDAINSIDANKRFVQKLWGKDGFLYNIKGTKTQYVIERIETDPDSGEPVLNAKGKEIKSEMSSPKTFIKQIVGPSGISPLKLQEMRPDEQVTWIRGLFSLSQDVLKEELRIKTEYETSYKSRTKAGNEYDRYKALTKDSPYYADQPKHEQYFKETSFEKLEEEFADIKTKYEEYTKYETSLENSKKIHLPNHERAVTNCLTEIMSIETEIENLNKALARKQQELESKQAEKVTLEQNVVTYKGRMDETNKWLEDNKAAKDNYENSNKKLVEATEFKAKKLNWETMLENQKQMNHFEDEYQRLTARLTALNEAKAKIVEMFTPKVEGLEVCIPSEEDKREGLFYFGKTLEQLCESELWEMATQLWKELDVRIIFVENISGLGTGAVDKFNMFIENGGYVLGTMMNRAEKNLKITFNAKIA